MIIGCYFIIKKPICADTLINRSEFKIDTEVISALSPPITCMNLHSDGHDSDCVFPVCVVLALRLNLWAFWTGSLIMWSVSSLLSVVTTLWPHRSKLLICIHGWGGNSWCTSPMNYSWWREVYWHTHRRHISEHLGHIRDWREQWPKP